MGTQINFLVSIRVNTDYLDEHEGRSEEDIAFSFIEDLQSDYSAIGVEFELLEVY